MENHNIIPFEDSSSTIRSPSSYELLPSDDTHPPCSTNNNEGLIMKTPWQVLEELAGSSDDEDGSDSGSIDGEALIAVVVGGGGGDSTMVKGAVAVTVSEKVQAKKKKTSTVREPPNGKPICSVCHMRAQPHCEYYGFFKPHVFGSPSSTQDEPPSEGDSANKSVDEDNNGGKHSASSPVQMLAFDLNEPLTMEERECSHAAEPAAEENSKHKKGKGLRFNLNDPPAEE